MPFGFKPIWWGFDEDVVDFVLQVQQYSNQHADRAATIAWQPRSQKCNSG